MTASATSSSTSGGYIGPCSALPTVAQPLSDELGANVAVSPSAPSAASVVSAPCVVSAASAPSVVSAASAPSAERTASEDWSELSDAANVRSGVLEVIGDYMRNPFSRRPRYTPQTGAFEVNRNQFMNMARTVPEGGPHVEWYALRCAA